MKQVLLYTCLFVLPIQLAIELPIELALELPIGPIGPIAIYLYIYIEDA